MDDEVLQVLLYVHAASASASAHAAFSMFIFRHSISLKAFCEKKWYNHKDTVLLYLGVFHHCIIERGKTRIEERFMVRKTSRHLPPY